jgi:hypothetical protein
MPHPPSQDLIDTFAELAAHTLPACGTCRSPFACCTGAQCEAARDTAKDLFDEDLPQGEGPIPFLAEGGCILPPHIRPICAVHVCERHLAAETPFARTYHDLRERAGDLLEEHMERVADVS